MFIDRVLIRHFQVTGYEEVKKKKNDRKLIFSLF